MKESGRDSLRDNMRYWPKDRNGNYFLTGCKVKDIYTDKIGVMKGYAVQYAYPKMVVEFDGEIGDTMCASVCLEVISGGLQTGSEPGTQR